MTKKFIFTIFICLLALSKVWAQSPNMINYQGVALNTGGTAIANQNISIRASVRNLTPTGAVLYSEVRNLTTESGGLFNFQIGVTGATATVGSWLAINWGTGAKHLQIEMDATGGTNFVDMGSQQLVSVPYAQYSNLSGGLIPTATINPNQINAGGATTNQVLKYNGSNWVPSADVSAFALPYAATNSSITSFEITNATGIAVKGVTTIGYGIMGEVTGSSGRGVYGISNGATGIGVNGESASGTAVKGYGNNVGSYGVFGSSLAGTGVYATSFTGTALNVNGNVKIGGGNTTPSAGAVLTSDVSGNATWKQQAKVGFKANQVAEQSLPDYTWVAINFSENYDNAGAFNVSSAVTDPNTFIAPISGFYNFECSAFVYQNSGAFNIEEVRCDFQVNGNSFSGHRSYGVQGGAFLSRCGLEASESFHLNAGDKVKLRLFQSSGGGVTGTSGSCTFSGHLIYAD